MNRNDDVNLIVLRLKLGTQRIDGHVQKTFRQIKSLHQMGAFLHIGGHKRQPFLKLGISLASRTDHVIEKFLRRLVYVSIEDHSA